MKHPKYDLIGDIHGCAKQLEQLLQKLGYRKKNGVYGHDERQAIFLGDFIDRGPDQKAVLDIVRPMIESGQALAVMGNHEFNAICYATALDNGKNEHIRPHTAKNTKQHQAFLDEFPFGSAEYEDAIAWFKTLPVHLDLQHIGVVHACWCEQSFRELKEEYLRADNTLSEDAYREYADEHSAFFRAIERILKGPEHPLPPELYFHDKDGHQRKNARIRWWEIAEKPLSQRLEFAGAGLSEQQKHLLDQGALVTEFNAPAKPVFVGHYWMSGTPKPLSDKVACIDYSVAKGGKMTAYRWSGEKNINKDNFSWV